LHTAVRQPHFLPYLGRRSCPPSQPIDLGIRAIGLDDVLHQEPWLASAWYQRREHRSHVALDMLIEVPPGTRGSDLQRDQPVTFNPRHRKYDLRAYSTATVKITNPYAKQARETQPRQTPTVPPAHDPTTGLEAV
jgi:CRISPR system Cascade subunit CasD